MEALASTLDNGIAALKGHQCLWCGDYFKNPERLLKHQIKVHKAPNPKRAICEFRAKTFDFKYILQRHIKKVHETGQYNCETCLKTFKIKETLRQHIRRYHFEGDEPNNKLFIL